MIEDKTKRGEMALEIRLKEYLQKIKEQEQVKPITEQRRVPTLKELAKASGVSRQNFARMVNNQTDFINKSTINTSIKTLRELGFNVEVNDIISFDSDS